MTGRVLLLRHPPVARAWAGRCYGRSDMGLSRAGAAMARDIVADIAGRGVTAVVHSDMRRTRPLAAAIARTAGCPAIAEPRWRERDFGSWEGRRWHSIWRETGDAMDRMMTDPAGFCPGGGETGANIATRAAAAWHDLPRGGVTVVVAHGGSIAAARAWLAGDSLEQMVGYIPACGAIVEVARDSRPSRAADPPARALRR